MTAGFAGKLISVEGIEGVGKSTAMAVIESCLQQANIDYVLTREPGGTEVAEAIRQVLLNHYQEPMAAETELLLMFASRAQHIATLVKPCLEKGQWVVSDRFVDASYAYQGAGRNMGADKVEILDEFVLGELQADRVIVLDAPVDMAMKRIEVRDSKDRIEQEQHQFFQRARDAYLERAAKFPERFSVVDASVALEQVEQQLKQIILAEIHDNA